VRPPNRRPGRRKSGSRPAGVQQRRVRAAPVRRTDAHRPALPDAGAGVLTARPPHAAAHHHPSALPAARSGTATASPGGRITDRGARHCQRLRLLSGSPSARPGAATGFASCPQRRPRRSTLPPVCSGRPEKHQRRPALPPASPPVRSAGRAARRCHQSAPARQKSTSGARRCHPLRLLSAAPAGPLDAATALLRQANERPRRSVLPPGFALGPMDGRGARIRVRRAHPPCSVAAPVQGCPLVSKTSSRDEEKDREQSAPVPHSARRQRSPASLSSLTLPPVLDRVFNTQTDAPDASTLR
jgi:hypothetical protein